MAGFSTQLLQRQQFFPVLCLYLLSTSLGQEVAAEFVNPVQMAVVVA
jgi:hypothetical protein